MLHELEHGERRADTSTLEALAEHAHDVADGAGPEGLARGQKVDVVVTELPSGVSGLLTDRIYVRRGLPRDVQVLVILHELAHAMLRGAGMDDPHGDVWRLALALAAPKPALAAMLRQGEVLPADLAAASGVPWWAASVRLDMTPVIFCIYGS
jgi:hypothetical protein